jgi:hypothetical protein
MGRIQGNILLLLKLSTRSLRRWAIIQRRAFWNYLKRRRLTLKPTKAFERNYSGETEHFSQWDFSAKASVKISTCSKLSECHGGYHEVFSFRGMAGPEFYYRSARFAKARAGLSNVPQPALPLYGFTDGVETTVNYAE